MLRLYGIGVSDDDARWLVGELYRDAHPPAVSAALMIAKSLDRGLYAVALEPAERTAILSVLNDCPDSLASLRAALLVDHTHRLQDRVMVNALDDLQLES
jgi:hypothetical protein